MGLLSIPGGLQGSPAGMSTQSHWVLMYPMQLFTGNVLLAAILGMQGTILQPATTGRELMSTVSPPTVSAMPAPSTRNKWQHHSFEWEATTPRPEEEEAVGLDITPEEWHCQRQKEGRPLARLLKESHQGDSKLVQLTRQAYFKTHCPVCNHKGSNNLSHTFKEMATSADLLGSDVHEVQQVWTGQKDLWVTLSVAKSSPKSIHFFWLVPPTKSPKIMGLKGIHSPKALR